MSIENIGILATPEDALIGSLERYLYGGQSIQTTTLVGILQLLKERREEKNELARQVSALQLSHDNIINSLGIKGDGPWSKLVIEYVMGLVAENVALREQSEDVYAAGYNHGHLNTVDGIAYAPCTKDDFYELALQVMVEAEAPNTEAAISEIKAQGADELADHMELNGFTNEAAGTREFAANLRAGRKG